MSRFVFYVIATVVAVLLQPAIAYCGPTWTIAVYMCGTDLESKYSAATSDLREMSEANIGGDVKVIVQTGGAAKWHVTIPNNMITRYEVTPNGLKPLMQLSDADMGNGATLRDFVAFVANEYPADHNMLVLWDHGGGAAAGVCMDERTQSMIPLQDVRAAIASVHQPDPANPFFDIIGMDACLMGTTETAVALHGLAEYLVASEEWEPGGGWMYTSWLTSLVANPGMPTVDIGKNIVNSYMADCQRVGQGAMATQGLIDVNRAKLAADAVSQLGTAAMGTPGAATQMGRAASEAENYGGNTPAQGYANMVDVVDWAQRFATVLPDATARVVQAVDNAVVMHAGGELRQRGHGLSVYFPLDGDIRMAAAYAQRAGACAPGGLVNLYRGMLTGVVRGGAQVDFHSAEPSVHHGRLTLDVEPALLGNVKRVGCALVYPDQAAGSMLHLGSSPRVSVDYATGHIADNLTADWPMLDNHMLHVEVVNVDADTALLAAPLVVNNERCALLFTEDLRTGVLTQIGVRSTRDDGAVDRGVRKLRFGDEVTTVHHAALLDGTGGFTDVELESFTIGLKGAQLTRGMLDDGVYAACFEFTLMNNDVQRSALAKFTVTDGKLRAETLN